MLKTNLKILSGYVMEQENGLTLEEFSCAIHADMETICSMVEYELIHPKGKSPTTWQFDSFCLQRARKAYRLQKDLELNLSGVGVILDLLDEIESLKRKMKTLEKYFR